MKPLLRQRPYLFRVSDLMRRTFFNVILTEVFMSTASYELDSWCEEFGTCCDNEDGLIANTACCTCGGGNDYLERCIDNPTFIDCNNWKCSDFYNDWAWFNDVSNSFECE